MDPSPAPTLSREVVSSPTATSPLFISVIVPVRNEARFIRRTLECLLGQDYDPARFEILVIDGESNDGTAEIVAGLAQDHANLRLLDNPRRLSSAARNVGIRNARGDVVLLVDGHCELRDRQHFRRLAAVFERSGADCVGRPQPLDVAGASTLQRAVAAARSSRLGHHPDSFIYSSAERFVPAKSVAVAYRRKVFDRAGYFDESFDACEDVELNHRIDLAGLTCFFAPEIAVHYAPRDTLRGLFRQLVRYGRGRVRLLRKHPETFSLGSMLPAAFTAGCVVGLPLSFLSGWLAMVYLTALLVYAAVVLLVSAWTAVRRGDPALLFWLPLVFATVHLGSGFGALREMIRR
jgi:succinoglycan biosynthesis protein ExoA